MKKLIQTREQKKKNMVLDRRAVLLVLANVLVLVSSVISHRGRQIQGVVYDGRSLIINGKRELLFSGSIHYPRSTPDVMNSITWDPSN